MIEGQIETITGDEMIRQPTQSISGIDGRPLTDCDGQCGGCTSHRPDELDADGETGRCDDCEPGAIPCDECEVVGERDADGDQDDPVLKAIDGEHWDFLVNPQTDLPDHNRSIRRIRTAYLDFKVARDSWIERTNRALESRKPSDGGDFERVIHFYKVSLDMTVGDETRSRIIEAHNADRAADKQRIAELERINSVAFRNGVESVGDKQAFDFLEMQKRIAELEAQAPKVVRPDKTDKGPHGLYGGRCECSHLLIGKEKFCSECGSKLNWEEA